MTRSRILSVSVAIVTAVSLATLPAPAQGAVGADEKPVAPPDKAIPLGLPNPWLYDTARRQPSTMYDVTVGDNQFAIPYSLDNSYNIPACCQAELGYDAASGLGVPQFTQLLQHVQVK